jgi:Rieske [2Fe-2S] domain
MTDEFERVADVAEVPPGTTKIVKVEGVELFVANVDGSFYALPNKCTHVGDPRAPRSLNALVLTLYPGYSPSATVFKMKNTIPAASRNEPADLTLESFLITSMRTMGSFGDHSSVRISAGAFYTNVPRYFSHVCVRQMKVES